MAEPLFLLQIVHANEKATIARIPGGGPLEADLISLFTRFIMAKNVGFFKTSAQVEKSVKLALADAIMAMKQQTTQITTNQPDTRF